MDWLCDADRDCQDGSDEADCGEALQIFWEQFWNYTQTDKIKMCLLLFVNVAILDECMAFFLGGCYEHDRRVRSTDARRSQDGGTHQPNYYH